MSNAPVAFLMVDSLPYAELTLVNVMSRQRSSNPRLLILSCSRKKHPAQGLLPALERYDGPAYRVINKFLRVHPSEKQSLNVYILSARFGLISDDERIPNCDHSVLSSGW